MKFSIQSINSIISYIPFQPLPTLIPVMDLKESINSSSNCAKTWAKAVLYSNLHFPSFSGKRGGLYTSQWFGLLIGINQSARFGGIAESKLDRQFGEMVLMESRSGGWGRGRMYDGIDLILRSGGRYGGIGIVGGDY
jgi:hypothetical protein